MAYTYGTEEDMLVVLGSAVLIFFVLLALYFKFIVPLVKEREYVKMEMRRSYSEDEYRFWKRELRRVYLNSGYTLANAAAKICQDILLNKISNSKMNKNIALKCGVVMYGLSNDKRRATRDLDLDFIEYSLADESSKLFIDKLK